MLRHKMNIIAFDNTQNLKSCGHSFYVHTSDIERPPFKSRIFQLPETE